MSSTSSRRRNVLSCLSLAGCPALAGSLGGICSQCGMQQCRQDAGVSSPLSWQTRAASWAEKPPLRLSCPADAHTIRFTLLQSPHASHTSSRCPPLVPKSLKNWCVHWHLKEPGQLDQGQQMSPGGKMIA